MKLPKFKSSTTAGGKIIKKIVAVVVSLLIILVSFLVLSKADRSAQETIDVVRVKKALPAYAVITESDVEKYSLIKKEHNQDMIPAEDIENVYGMLTAYYIRQGGMLYKDQIVSERPLKNEWLYQLDVEEEVVTVPYNYLEAGGDILVPGDTIRIRVSYEVEEEPSPYDNPNSYYQDGKKYMKTEVLFDSIVVKDMLNSSSHSVYEVYKEMMRLDEQQRQLAMKSKEFINSIKPKSLLLSGTSDDMEKYAKFKALVGEGKFLITILSRANSDVVLDQLPALEVEIEGWIQEGQDKK